MTRPPRPPASKEDWRHWARAVRAGLDLDFISAEVVDLLERWDPLREASKVLLFLPLPDEIDLRALFDRHLEATFAATRTPSSGPLTVHELGGRLERHPFGFSQPGPEAPPLDPGQLDVLLIPGLAFDRHGVRLGRGVGYFDELLAQVSPRAPLVGVVPEALIVDALPSDTHDVLMTHLASELGVAAVGHG